MTRCQEKIQDFNYDEQEDVEGCVERCSIKFEKELYMNYREINYESRDKMKTIKDKQNLIVDAADLVRSVWRPFKTEALAEKVKVIKLQG